MDAKLEELSFTYFPENYRWSHGLLIGLNMAPWGGAEIGEVNRVGLRLKNRIGDDDAWFREWAREARTVEDRGRERIAEGFTTSGAQYLHRASAYYHVGERFLQPKSKEGLDAYMRGVACFRDAAKYIKRPRMEHVEIPYDGHEPAGGLCPRRTGEFLRQGAGRGVFRRARCHQGDPVFQRRRRPGRARHRLPHRGRARQRRKHPLPQSLSAARHRALRDAGL